MKGKVSQRQESNVRKYSNTDRIKRTDHYHNKALLHENMKNEEVPLIEVEWDL